MSSGVASHRAVANIRVGQPTSASGPTSPATPSRQFYPSFGSPSSIKGDDDVVVIEVGSRFVRVGFAGDPLPKAQIQLRPEQQRRVGDLRVWAAGYQDDGLTGRKTGRDWSEDYELWRPDLRTVDLGVVEDKLDRILREAFTKYLLVDSKPRKMALVLPSALPLPLLATILDVLFNRFQSPLISLLSSGTMSAVAAGVRSALVVDLGWTETVVTSIYEYREVACTRTVRGGKLLVEKVHELLRNMLRKSLAPSDEDRRDQDEHIVSFDECEELVVRLMWCKPLSSSTPSSPSGLPTVEEQDELEQEATTQSRQQLSVQIPLKSTRPPTKLELSYFQLGEVCENLYLEARPGAPYTFDDEELPLHWLIYRHLLHLPIDARAACMSRIVFTGGCSRILGLRGRIFDELSSIVAGRGWDPVTGKGAEAYRCNSKLKRQGPRPTNGGAVPEDRPDDDQDGVWHDAANAEPETNTIDIQLDKDKSPESPDHGYLGALETLGPWSGASLTCQLKVMAISTIERDAWLQSGINGASKPGDVDLRAQQRQSMGPGHMKAAGLDRSWTLGAWGAF